jgi:hypothetical protein
MESISAKEQRIHEANKVKRLSTVYDAVAGTLSFLILRASPLTTFRSDIGIWIHPECARNCIHARYHFYLIFRCTARGSAVSKKKCTT